MLLHLFCLVLAEFYVSPGMVLQQSCRSISCSSGWLLDVLLLTESIMPPERILVRRYGFIPCHLRLKLLRSFQFRFFRFHVLPFAIELVTVISVSVLSFSCSGVCSCQIHHCLACSGPQLSSQELLLVYCCGKHLFFHSWLLHSWQFPHPHCG